MTLESNNLFMLQTGKEATRSVKKNKNNFINVIEDTFAKSIRWGKLTNAFLGHFSCINYLELLK